MKSADTLALHRDTPGIAPPLGALGNDD